MQPILDELYAKSRSGTVFTNLLPLICSENNIKMAYRNIRKNAGSKTPGTDGRTIRSLDTWSTQRLIGHIQSKFNWYKPQSVRRVEIPKPNGKTRPLGIPTITDRLVQQCILQILEPICEAKFHPHSFGFRPNRGCEHAIAAAYFKMQKQHLHYVVDIDIKGFSDNVNHGKSHEIRYLNGYPLLPLSAIDDLMQYFCRWHAEGDNTSSVPYEGNRSHRSEERWDHPTIKESAVISPVTWNRCWESIYCRTLQSL